MIGETTSLAELFRQLCLAADEYMLARNNMMKSPQLTWPQVEQALKLGDRVQAVLRMIRGRQALLTQLFEQEAPKPEPVPTYPDGTVLGTGPNAPVGAPPCSAWQCPNCNEVLWVIGATRPAGCPCCGARFA